MTGHTLGGIILTFYSVMMIGLFSIGYVQEAEAVDEPATADEIKNIDVSLLYKFALTRSGYTSPALKDATLTIVFTTQKAMQDAFFGGDKVGIDGFYPWDGNEIYIALKVGTEPYGRSVIVHEIVHYLQDKNNMPKNTCEELMVKEKHSYKIQNLYLKRYNMSMYTHITPENSCIGLAKESQ